MSEEPTDSDRQLTVIAPARVSVAPGGALVVPALIAHAGEHATRRFLEFFAATIRNRNTRQAYLHAAGRFFGWCDRHHVGQLADIEPLHIAAYIEALQAGFEKPTVKQHLAAIRMLFDWLVTGHVVAVNPATSVHGPKHVVKRGKTTVLTADEARALLDSIPINRKVELADATSGDVPDLVGLRDRALISVMTYAFGRISAVLGMRVEDYYPQGKRWWVRLHEKGGKRHEMPAHHTLSTTSTPTSRRPASAMRASLPSSGRRLGALACSPTGQCIAWTPIR